MKHSKIYDIVEEFLTVSLPELTDFDCILFMLSKKLHKFKNNSVFGKVNQALEQRSLTN